MSRRPISPPAASERPRAYWQILADGTSARSHRRRRRRFAVTVVVAASSAVVAVVLASHAMPRGEVVVETTDLVASSPVVPSDAAPTVSASGPSPTIRVASFGSLGAASGIAAPPTSIAIEAISLDASVRAVGVAEDGTLEIPDRYQVGWYDGGARPGHPGATVLAAHVSWDREPGPFARLGRLGSGAEIRVTTADGSSRSYRVVERRMFDKEALPAERIWRTSGVEELVLITCGGDFDESVRRYEQNIVVFAVPADR